MTYLKLLIQEAHYLLKAKTSSKPLEDNFTQTAKWYKTLHPNTKKEFLQHHLPNWPEDAKQHFSVLAQNYHQHGLTPQDSVDLWNSATGGTRFGDYYDYLDFKDTVDWSKKKGWEPKNLNRSLGLG